MIVKNQEELSSIVYQYETDWYLDSKEINNWSKLFKNPSKKDKIGIRFHHMSCISSVITYNNTVNVMGLFYDINEKSNVNDPSSVPVIEVIARWVKIVEHFNFSFGFAVHDFCFYDNLTPRDKLIQTVKFEIMMEEALKNKRMFTEDEYTKRCNESDIIEKAKIRVDYNEQYALSEELVAFKSDNGVYQMK